MKVIDLNPLLEYFQKLSESMNRIFPEEITWENAFDYHYDLSFCKHPKWVHLYFPLVLIIYREKAGKLRKSKYESIMYQNNFNVITQAVWSPNEFGIFNRKNSHKGFKDIIGAIQADENDFKSYYHDRERPKKYKNFDELFRLKDPENLAFKAFCEVLQENYPCDSHGQTRLL